MQQLQPQPKAAELGTSMFDPLRDLEREQRRAR
jgi:hypothetical protein